MFAAAVLLGLLLAGGSAEEGDPEVRRAVGLYDELRFDEVAPLLERALERPLSEADQVRALAYLGRAYAVFQRRERAVAAFTRLLDLAPDFTADDYESPLIRDALSAARQRPRAPAAATEEAPSPAKPARLPAAMLAPSAAATTSAPSALEQPWWRSGWVWTAAAAGVVLVGGGVLAALRPWASEPPATSLGRWQL